MPHSDIVKASEIAEYVYCKRSWWLRFNEKITGSTEAMDLGTLRHNELAEKVESHSIKKSLALILIFSGLILLILIIITAFLS